jgi:hypothetical protein
MPTSEVSATFFGILFSGFGFEWELRIGAPGPKNLASLLERAQFVAAACKKPQNLAALAPRGWLGADNLKLDSMIQDLETTKHAPAPGPRIVMLLATLSWPLVSVMVPSTPVASMVSPAAAPASAARSEPGPLSLMLVTGMVAARRPAGGAPSQARHARKAKAKGGRRKAEVSLVFMMSFLFQLPTRGARWDPSVDATRAPAKSWQRDSDTIKFLRFSGVEIGDGDSGAIGQRAAGAGQGGEGDAARLVVNCGV